MKLSFTTHLSKLLPQTLGFKKSLISKNNFPKYIHSMASNCSEKELLESVKSFVPVLSNNLHKGQSGRIGVVGGSKEYTGAPYFSAISILKVGADLSHVFCMEQAGSVIKSYSPELIVHPVLDHPHGFEEVAEWLPRLHSLVIGPGLGRDQNIYSNFKAIITKAKEIDLPLVIDADGVYFVTQEPLLIGGYKKATLTPNRIEFIRLYEKVFDKKPDGDNWAENTKLLAKKLGGVTIVNKGIEDIISDGTATVNCSREGSVRRCGGQGDLLSGSMGTFAFWAYNAVKSATFSNPIVHKYGPNICAAFGACYLTRACSHLAFKRKKRSMTTTDMIDCIGQVFENTFE